MASIQQVQLVTPVAMSTPVVGSVTGTTPVQTADFTPQLGRDLYITLTGTWTGTVQVQRSYDGGVTWNNITYGGGTAWGHYTANCDEVVDHPTNGNATYQLNITLSAGTVNYRLAQ